MVCQQIFLVNPGFAVCSRRTERRNSGRLNQTTSNGRVMEDFNPGPDDAPIYIFREIAADQRVKAGGSMDVKAILEAGEWEDGAPAEITGWLVDARTGLVILAEHFPEDFDYPIRIEVENGNIMYAIRWAVPALGGGKSTLFSRCRTGGRIVKRDRFRFVIETLQVENTCGSGVYDEVPLDAQLVDACTEQWGDFKFNYPRGTRDWMRDAEC